MERYHLSPREEVRLNAMPVRQLPIPPSTTTPPREVIGYVNPVMVNVTICPEERHLRDDPMSDRIVEDYQEEHDITLIIDEGTEEELYLFLNIITNKKVFDKKRNNTFPFLKEVIQRLYND